MSLRRRMEMTPEEARRAALRKFGNVALATPSVMAAALALTRPIAALRSE